MRQIALLLAVALLVLAAAATLRVLRAPDGPPGEARPSAELLGSADPATLVHVDCWFDTPRNMRTRCGWVVPTTRAADGSAAALPVVRLLRDAPWRSRQVTLVVSGGPGGSNYLDAEGMPGWLEWRDRLGLDHDLALYDQRGTGLSWPRITCPALLELDRRQLEDARPLDARFAEYEQALLRCAQVVPAADRRTGLYGTRVAAQDLRDVVAALRAEGYRSISVYAVSYGTRLAVEAFAGNALVDALVLDSPYPVGVDLLNTYPDSLDAVLRRIDDYCAQDPSCEAGTTLRKLLADAVARFTQAPETITADADWLDAPQRVHIDGAMVLALVEFALYAGGEPAEVVQRVREAARGELDGPEWDELISTWVWDYLDPGFNTLSQWLIECRDNPPADPAAHAAMVARFPDWAPALEVAEGEFALCERLGVPPEPLQPRALDQPTLVLGSDLDPRTPADLVLSPYETFPRATVLRRATGGHSLVDTDACAADTAGAFLNGRPVTSDACSAVP